MALVCEDKRWVKLAQVCIQWWALLLAALNTTLRLTSDFFRASLLITIDFLETSLILFFQYSETSCESLVEITLTLSFILKISVTLFQYYADNFF
jgi:hypothetical protein